MEDAGSYVSDLFFNGPPNGPGRGFGFFFNGPPNNPGGIRFSMVRPTGLRGFGFFFQWCAQRVCGVGVGFFQWSAQRAREGFRFFFNGPPNGPGGKGGQSALEFGGGVVGFLFRGDGGQSASVKGGWRRVSFGVVFCGEWRRVSFRGCEGGRGASQLWSLVVVSSVFLFRGDGGQSASGAVKGEGGPVSGGGVVGFFVSGGRGPVSFRGCEGGMEASQLWSCVLRGMEASQLPGL